MIRIKLDSDLIKLINLFESMTGAKVKDCITNEKLIFVVEENDMAKAIGKNGSNVKRIEKALKKKVKLVEFSSDVTQFVRNFIYPMQTEVTEAEGIVTINGKDVNTRAILIGRERQNISHLNNITKRYFDVKEIKVI